ncbi:MAG: cysteine desulfurase NifS [Candidatus Firestonebacteria bacterium RIFOXYA2_FULL_40_8]|nr:MAG: cysteine desulfurase NifS [Candidatus Firestonebacteria bacterium RIFOXYA2_FULL_40_8]
MKKVYLDNAACTPLDPRVFEVMTPYFVEEYGNPATIHSYGLAPREGMEKAREQVGLLLNAKPENVFFTSNGSESNNMAIKGVCFANQARGKHIIVSEIEHFSVLQAVKSMEKLGFTSSQLKVGTDGIVKTDELKNLIKDETVLVSIMLANHEIGTIQPIAEAAAVIKKINADRVLRKLQPVYLHTDAVAAVGVIPVDVEALGIDLLSLASSSFYGPKGAAALYIRNGVRINPLIDGGIQEGGRRAGLENVPAIVGMGKAAEFAKSEMIERNKKMEPLRDLMIQLILKNITQVRLNGDAKKRLPGNVNVSVEFIEGESMLMWLDDVGIAASSGSACTSKALKASHVLLSIGVPQEVCHGSMLFSLNKDITKTEVEFAAEEFTKIVKKLREMSPLYKKS